MRLYARPSWRMVGQIGADASVVVWAFAWWFVGRGVHVAVELLAVPSREIGNALRGLKGQVASAADRTGDVPYVGPEIRRPFDDMAGSLDSMIASTDGQVTSILQVATWAGWLTFLIPVLTVLLLWLPVRLRFVSRARATDALVGPAGGTDLLALRALATQPIAKLRAISSDPVADWRAGDPHVIAALSELELRRAGLSGRRRP